MTAAELRKDKKDNSISKLRSIIATSKLMVDPNGKCCWVHNNWIDSKISEGWKLM